ncbi:unnamed protein product [Timema podura]|uniref:WD repeat-containing protein 18 n=1 Tax=Timema podura TaxID=61482 RepID=A0ABN7NFT1_TIMPD|nr:unnamed protein product [Timema podura]
MSHTTEVVVTSDASGQLWSGCIWDPHTGNALMTYKSGGVAAPHCLSLLGSDYLLTADTTKPLLRVWALNSHEPVQQGIRLVVPGRVSALATSPDGLYLVAAVDCKLYIWQINSGDLLSVAARHFLRITVIKFTDDGCLFASAGEDSMVMVWSLQSLISQHDANMSLQQEPLYSYSDHALAVHDIYIGPGGMRSRMYTVSADRTCKVYDLSSGTLLLSMAFDSRLSSVAVDPTETEVFVGTIQGDIYQFTLRQPPRDIENFMLETSPAKSFVGHKKTVACLSVSQDGLILLSGSEDGIVMLWHIPSRQSTKTLVHKGPVTNAFFHLAPKHIFTNELKPKIFLHSLKRSIEDNSESFFEVLTTTKHLLSDDDSENDNDNDEGWKISNKESITDPEIELKKEIAHLKYVNEQLYKYAAAKILQPFADINIQDNLQTGVLPTVANIPTAPSKKKKQDRNKGKKIKKTKKV